MNRRYPLYGLSFLFCPFAICTPPARDAGLSLEQRIAKDAVDELERDIARAQRDAELAASRAEAARARLARLIALRQQGA